MGIVGLFELVGTKGAIAHWDGRALSAAKSPATKTLLAVRGTSATDVWALGEELVHWDGTTWTVVDAPKKGLWRGLCGAGKELWAVGGHPSRGPRSESTLMRWRDGAWKPESPIEGEPGLSSCVVTSSGELWVGGGDGLVAVRKRAP